MIKVLHLCVLMPFRILQEGAATLTLPSSLSLANAEQHLRIAFLDILPPSKNFFSFCPTRPTCIKGNNLRSIPGNSRKNISHQVMHVIPRFHAQLNYSSLSWLCDTDRCSFARVKNIFDFVPAAPVASLNT